MLSRIVAVCLLAGALTGCATISARAPGPVNARTPVPAPLPPPPATISTPPPPAAETPPQHSPFEALAGWATEDHAAAFRAFLSGCPVARDEAMSRVCRRAAVAGELDEAQARAFLEHNFRPRALPAEGVLTAYFTPVYDARSRRVGDFTAPVRPRPADLPRPVPGASVVYADRAEIERRPAAGALAWMRPEDLFFLQIQGSGVLVFDDGARRRAVFDGSNGAPFLGLAAPMRARGLITDGDTSAQRIHDWLADHRGVEADHLMRLNRRYVFFRLQPDDGLEPAGAAGLRLTPGRALAVDPLSHPMGEVLWIDADTPMLPGAFPAYRRLAMALDTGGAIKGEARADLYLGRGPEAGAEAGRVRHVLHLYRLEPLETPAS